MRKGFLYEKFVINYIWVSSHILKQCTFYEVDHVLLRGSLFVLYSLHPSGKKFVAHLHAFPLERIIQPCLPAGRLYEVARKRGWPHGFYNNATCLAGRQVLRS